MKVKATQSGFYGGSRRRPGDIFDVKEGEVGRWMEVIDEADAPVVAAKPARAARGSARRHEPVEAPSSTGDQDVI